MTQSTDVAQRNLIEALAQLERTKGGLGGFLSALPFAIEVSENSGQPDLTNCWRKLFELAAAVQRDLKEAKDG